jgi:hypothetical protein
MNLQSVEFKELEAEYKRRLKQQEEEKKQERELRACQLQASLDRNIVNAIAPKHDCTNCHADDSDLDNGYYGGKSLPRCRRCTLLTAVNSGYWERDLKLSVVLSID